MLEKTYKTKSGRFRNCAKVLSKAKLSKILNSGEEGNSSLCLKAEASLP
jgi:hypothetical protein